MKRFASISIWLGVLPALTVASVGCVEECTLRPHTQKQLRKVKIVAVVPFVDAPGPLGKGSGRVVVSAVIAELYDCPGLRVVERQRLDVVMKEHDLKLSQLQTNEGAAKAGKILGVDTMILGEIQQFQDNKDIGFGGAMGITGGETRSEFFVGMVIRAVRVSDGQVIYAESGHGKSKEGISPASEQASKKALKQWQLFFEQEDRNRTQDEKEKARAEAERIKKEAREEAERIKTEARKEIQEAKDKAKTKK